MHPVIEQVTQRIIERSAASRKNYLERISQANQDKPPRSSLGCSNLAHGMAACDVRGKESIQNDNAPNLAIITAYNDMLSAHAPYESYPTLIRETARAAGASAQVAGGVPAMCDGVTQGREGMELSLFSRDVIAMSTAVALSHDMFDAALYLGVCDKIVPGLLIGALTYGHLPGVFVPAGPMPSGLPNQEKAAVRESYATGKVGRDALLAAESASYHSPGTCTFYGTANSNQMLLEFMGLQLPGSSFEQPGTTTRDRLTRAATHQAIAITANTDNYTPIGHIVDEKAVVNGIIGLLATGGSTNHTIHLISVAAAAGVRIDWQDFADLATVIPLLANVYPNGSADVNHFHAAGGLGFVIGELLINKLMHAEVRTILGEGLKTFACAPEYPQEGAVTWTNPITSSADRSVLREVGTPFQTEGGLKVLQGEIGRAVVKVSAVNPEHQKISAPARVFRSQAAFLAAFEAGALNNDFVAVVTHQGPAANGMPELHKLSPALGSLQSAGHKVALLTDGRMSGASGKVLAAIQVSPEAQSGGWIGRIQDGDLIHIDATSSTLTTDADLENREQAAAEVDSNHGTGRELFGLFRHSVGAATEGASVFG